MGLISQRFGGPCWQFEVDNITGTPGAAIPGTGVPSGSANGDGANANVISALAADVCYVVLAISDIVTAAEDNSALMDILIDRAGGTSYSSLIDDLVCGFGGGGSGGTANPVHIYHFPLWIPAGASIGARCRKTGATATTARLAMWLYGRPRNPDAWWCGQGVESVGVVAATSKGTAHTPGNSGAFSSFATIGTTTRRFGSVQLGMQSGQSVQNALSYHWQLGLGGAQIPGTPTVHESESTGEAMSRHGPSTPIWCDIPGGSTLQTRATCSGTAQAHNVAAYGVY